MGRDLPRVVPRTQSRPYTAFTTAIDSCAPRPDAHRAGRRDGHRAAILHELRRRYRVARKPSRAAGSSILNWLNRRREFRIPCQALRKSLDPREVMQAIHVRTVAEWSLVKEAGLTKGPQAPPSQFDAVCDG
jgi:hypothetical protein